MNTKKIVLVIALVALAFVFVINNPIMFGFCRNMSISNYGKYCYDPIFDVSETILLLGLFLGGYLLLLSLITYKMRDDVFRAWWRFARWFAPVIIIVTLLLENAGGGGGIGIGGAVSSAFDILILGILYAILVIVSLILIIRKYFATRHK